LGLIVRVGDGRVHEVYALGIAIHRVDAEAVNPLLELESDRIIINGPPTLRVFLVEIRLARSVDVEVILLGLFILGLGWAAEVAPLIGGRIALARCIVSCWTLYVLVSLGRVK
jgi:hypothetical protein